jgi:Dolichyl-phosphate-mannose-protein mannosyltransferase
MGLEGRTLDWVIGAALTLGGVATRVPYLTLLPIFNDCVLQPVFAMNIRPGGYMPLVGNDPYAGAIFLYILAASLRVFASPLTPLVVVMLMGALTVGLTYLLARALKVSPVWAALAGLLMMANPLHILVNSHVAGASYIVPLFSTACLAALALAVNRNNEFRAGWWMVVAGAMLGFAMQANPIVALMLPGVAVWFLTLRQSAVGLRTRWPYLAALAFLVAYSPVILYNLQSGLEGVREAQIRDYIWQPTPSLSAYVQNLGRLLLQLARQLSGVILAGESFSALIGAPLFYSAWAIAGLVYAARRGLSLPAWAVGSQVLITPWLSNYYGLTIETRFTNQLTPLIVIAMSVLAADVWAFARRQLSRPAANTMTWLAGALLVALSLWPLVPLFEYYEHETVRGESNAPFFAFSDEFIQQWRGERVLVSDSLGRFNPTEFFLATNRIPYDAMPFGRIMERLAVGQETGPVVLILEKGDLARARTQADLVAWDTPAMQTARKMGYGAYTIADARQVRKPTFVFTDTTLGPTMRAVQADFAGRLGILGFEVNAATGTPGGDLIVNVHWRATSAMSETYTGFLHLVGPDGRLVAQDDHELGRGFYRTIFWQPGEVVRERYALTLPEDAPSGQYTLKTGVYSFPSLKRLPVRSASTAAQDDMVTLGPISVGP